MLYVLEGSAVHSQPGGTKEELSAGSVLLLTSPGDSTHGATPGKGRISRWISIVLQLPNRVNDGAPSTLITHPMAADLSADGTEATHLTGVPGHPALASGLEASDIRFVNEGTSFLEAGHARRGVIYVLNGTGLIENEKIEVGEAALVERVGGVALHGSAGFQVIVATAPIESA